jgi:predicted phosphoadenosine phosphosulfate sulfurtransferase
MPKIYLDKDVLIASQERISWTLDRFPRIYIAFSGGKDSTVMLHLVMDEAIKRNRKVAICFIDLEAQYKFTIDHVQNCFDIYKDHIESYWICLPIVLFNGVSVYETHWFPWDPEKQKAWVRNIPKGTISDENHFSFFRKGMEFEEFVPEFGEWYSNNELCACFVGIRSDESLNRYRTISSIKKTRLENKLWTTLIKPNTDCKVYNIYPIYDWRTEDIWTYHGKHPDKPYNKVYDLMYKAGLSIHQSRLCQPYGYDQRKGLWLFHLIEPETWARIVARVNGANSGAMYAQESGNITGYRRISKPEGHTWKSFAYLLLNSMPPKTKEHFENKIILFRKWWMERGYEETGIPDEADYRLETARKVPSWRRICKSLLRNDYWCKGLGYSQTISDAYKQYLDLMRRRKAEWKESQARWNLENR